MSTPFNPLQGLIVVVVRIDGPMGHAFARLALDTGATSTLIDVSILVGLGYDPATSPDRVRISTASGIEYVAQLSLDRVETLGQVRTQFSVVAHTLPPSTSVDGLLGLDFFRGTELVIDFRAGQVDVR